MEMGTAERNSMGIRVEEGDSSGSSPARTGSNGTLTTTAAATTTTAAAAAAAAAR